MSATEASAGAADTTVPNVDLKLEVVVIPVSDVDRAKAFYVGLGWRLDADFPFRQRRQDRPDHPARVAVLDPVREKADDRPARVRGEPVSGRLRHRSRPRGAHRTRRAGQRGLPPGRSRRAVPARGRRGSRRRARARPRHLRLVCHLHRPGRQPLAVAGDHPSAPRTSGRRRHLIYERQRPRRRDAARVGSARRAREAHRRGRRELAGLVRRVHGGRAGRPGAAYLTDRRRRARRPGQRA